MTRFTPATIDELQEAVATALAAEEPLEIVGGGSKRGLGRPLQTPHVLDLSRLSGVREYEPAELVLTAGAATPLDEIEALLARNGQMLGFEPPDWRALLGTQDMRPTLGGALACNLSGPRRIKAGAARDHFLGFRGVSGRGEIFKAGGKVVKNVTGYDLPKLMAGSYGTLAAFEEVTVKVVPRPETACTVTFEPVDPDGAVRLMTTVLGSPLEVSAASYNVGIMERQTAFGERADPVVMFRLEGPAPSVAFRRDQLIAMGPTGARCDIDGDVPSWASVRDCGPFAWEFLDAPGYAVWRISIAPTRGAELAQRLQREIEAWWFLDWGGGLLWLAVEDQPDGGASVIRRAVKGADGAGTGHATLIRSSLGLRREVPVFEPQVPPLAALSKRVKDGFDPRHILNPGRMVDGV